MAWPSLAQCAFKWLQATSVACASISAVLSCPETSSTVQLALSSQRCQSASMLWLLKSSFQLASVAPECHL
eukprot:13942-Amphidinium_carterae.2